MRKEYSLSFYSFFLSLSFFAFYYQDFIAKGSLCSTFIHRSQYHWLFWKEKALLWGWPARRPKAELKSLTQGLLWDSRLSGPVSRGQLWELATYGKTWWGASALDLPERVPALSFQYVPVFWFHWGWQTLVPGAHGGSNSLLRTCFSCMTCGFVLLSTEHNKYLVPNRASLSWFYDHHVLIKNKSCGS